jgi:hypothetical protein
MKHIAETSTIHYTSATQENIKEESIRIPRTFTTTLMHISRGSHYIPENS